MSHLPDLISDLALILISAGIITLLFKWLKQPLVLGYIVAGLLAGPYVQIFPTVVDVENINLWAEMGVVFLFALGLEFSFKKLMNVGSTAFITAMTEVITMLIVGYLVGHLLGWSTMNSIFLGGMLSMSSTTIIIKAFDDLGLRSQRFTGIVFGTLVVEDLVAIIMMVLLSTMAVSQEFAGEEMIGSILKVAFFLILWFLVGIFIIPAFLKKVKKLMNDETLLVIALGLCLGMVVVGRAHRTYYQACQGFVWRHLFCVGRYAGRSGCPGAICMACHSDHFGDDRGEGFLFVFRSTSVRTTAENIYSVGFQSGSDR